MVTSERHGGELVEPQGGTAGRGACVLFDLFSRAAHRHRRCGRGAHIWAGRRARRGQRAAARPPRPDRGAGRQCDAAWSQPTPGRDPGNGVRRRHLGVGRARPRRPAQGRAQHRVGGGASAQERHLGFRSDVYCLVGGRAFARVPAAGVVAADGRAGRGRQVLCSLRAGLRCTHSAAPSPSEWSRSCSG